MTDSKNEQLENQKADFERLSSYANSLERKYQQPRNLNQEDDFERFLSAEETEEAAAPESEPENETLEEDEEEDDQEQSFFARGLSFIDERKYLLVLIPVFFLLLFLLTLNRTHTGTIKTEAFTYSGQILNDAPNGKGTMTYANGDSYNGNFKTGKFSGSGTFTAKSSNWSFAGTFKNGLPDGKGVMTTPDGTKHEETYKNGVLAR